MVKVRELIKNGAIGKIANVNVSLGFVAEKRHPSKDHRLFKMDCGGGALLDVGVYCLSAISMVAKCIDPEMKATSIQSSMEFDEETKTDNQCTAVVTYKSNNNHTRPLMATFSCSFLCEYPRRLEICGTEGIITVSNSFHRPESVTLDETNGKVSVFDFPKEYAYGLGYYYEILHLLHMISDKQVESPVMPLQETIEIMQIMDAIRKQHNFFYPKEE